MRRTTIGTCAAGVLLAVAGCSGSTTRSHDGHHDDLTYGEIMDRCLPQLQHDWKRTFLHRPTAANLVLRNPVLPHRAGDIIGVGFRGQQDDRRGSSGTYCVIPDHGHEHDPVPASQLRPNPSDPRQIGELCTEADGEGGAGDGRLSGTGDIANLSLHQGDVTVYAKASLGHRVVVLFGGGDITSAGLTCALDDGDDQLEAVAPAQRIAYVDETAPPHDSRVLYYGAGLTTPKAHTIEIDPPGGRIYRIPVRRVTVNTGYLAATAFGAYAFFVNVQYPRGYYGTFPVRVLDAAGNVLSTSQWDSADMDRL